MSKALEKQLELEITQLFGKSSYIRIATPCRGKFAGKKDYGLKFDDGTYFYISLGKKSYISNLEHDIKQIKEFHKNKEAIMSMLNATVFKVDKEKSKLWGKKHTKLLDIRIAHDTVGVVAKLQCSDSNTYELRETNLTYAIMNGIETVVRYINSRMYLQTIPTAHNFSELDCDMILCGYLWNSNKLEKITSTTHRLK